MKTYSSWPKPNTLQSSSSVYSCFLSSSIKLSILHARAWTWDKAFFGSSTMREETHSSSRNGFFMATARCFIGCFMFHMQNNQMVLMGFPGGSDEESACNLGDLGLIPGSGRSLGEGKAIHISFGDMLSYVSNPLFPSSCLLIAWQKLLSTEIAHHNSLYKSKKNLSPNSLLLFYSLLTHSCPEEPLTK